MNLLPTTPPAMDSERFASVVPQTGTTTHLDFPIPQMVPESGSASPFCIDVTILNGNHADIIDITAVGSLR